MASIHQAYLKQLEEEYERPMLVRNLMPKPAAALSVTIALAAGQGNPVNAGPINFTVTFSKVATGFTNADISFAGSTVGGTLAAAVTGTGPAYNVAVTGMTGNGIVAASVVNASATDATGAPFPASNTVTVMLDTTVPSVTVDRAVGQADPTTVALVNFTAVFSEQVVGFTSSDISFTGSTVGGTLAAAVTGSGPTYNVAVTGMTSAGNVVASIPAASVTDMAGNANTASTSTDNSVAFDASLDPFWTSFTASLPTGEGSAFAGAGTRQIFVSQSTGADANPGTQASPKKTIAGGLALVRSGSPDWLLFKKGDTWTDEVFGNVAFNGPSSSAPILIGAYGTGARPKFKTNPSSGDRVVGTTGAVATRCSNVAFVGLEFYAYTRNPADPGYNAGTVGSDHLGFFMLSTFDWQLWEDCKISFYGINSVNQNDTLRANSTFRMRRCVITDNYATVGHSEGLYIQYVDFPYFEENVWDFGGWLPGIAGGNIFNRNLYIEQHCGYNNHTTVIGNIFANSSCEGMQARTGGVVTNNFFVNNPIGFDIGHPSSDEFVQATTQATVNNNVVMASGDINNDPVNGPRGYGISVNNTAAPSVLITNNIIAHSASGRTFGIGIFFANDAAGATATGNIIFDWLMDDLILNNGTGNTTAPNDLDRNGTNNNPGGTAPHEPFAAPTRTVGSYYGSIGGSPATTAGFITAARLQSKDNWNAALKADAVNTYIRAGFASGVAASLTFQGVSASVGSGLTYTLPFTVASAAGQERLLAVLGTGKNPLASVSFLTVTVDGQTATQVGATVKTADASGNGAVVSFWRVPGTAGTSFNAVVGVTGSVDFFDVRAVLWTLTNAGTLLASVNGSRTYSGSANIGNADLSINTAAGGAVAAITYGYNSTVRAVTWTGLTERFDGGTAFTADWYSAADLSLATAATPLTITATLPTDFAAGSAGVSAFAVSFNHV